MIDTPTGVTTRAARANSVFLENSVVLIENYPKATDGPRRVPAKIVGQSSCPKPSVSQKQDKPSNTEKGLLVESKKYTFLDLNFSLASELIEGKSLPRRGSKKSKKPVKDTQAYTSVDL